MKRLLKISVIALVGILLTSCASQVRITKRKHRKGFYVSTDLRVKRITKTCDIQNSIVNRPLIKKEKGSPESKEQNKLKQSQVYIKERTAKLQSGEKHMSLYRSLVSSPLNNIQQDTAKIEVDQAVTDIKESDNMILIGRGTSLLSMIFSLVNVFSDLDRGILQFVVAFLIAAAGGLLVVLGIVKYKAASDHSKMKSRHKLAIGFAIAGGAFVGISFLIAMIIHMFNNLGAGSYGG